MGTIQKGILGGFSGTVGTVVGANWRGMDVMRSRPKKSDRPATEKQLMQQQKFSLVSKFLAPIGFLLKKYFGQPQEEKSRRNLAVSYHIQEAIMGEFPGYAIDYEKVIISKGELLNAQEPVLTPQAGAILALAWEDNSGQGLAKATDGLLAITYNDNKKLYDVRENAASRNALAYAISLPDNWTGDTVQCWISFVSEDGKKFANSLFTGSFEVL